MIQLAAANPISSNIRFRVCSPQLEAVSETFDVILDRHAPFDLDAIAAHLKPVGYFVTQQVGERDMACVQAALGQTAQRPRPARPRSTGSSPGTWMSEAS